MKDKTDKYIHCWPQFTNDGHPSYSPDGSLIVTDSYPDRARVASINLMDGNERKRENITIARVFAPFKYDNDTRCDLHPRWNHAGDKICFDSVFEGHRGLYVVDVPEGIKKSVKATDSVGEYSLAQKGNEKENINIPKYSIITPMYNSFDLMRRYFDSLERQSLKNFEVIIVDDCSTDNSYKNMKEYAKTTPLKMTILKTEKNAGPGNARNLGMDVAKGEWITFIDNDDWVDTDLLRKIENVVSKEKVNCVIYDYYTTDGEKKSVSRSMYSGQAGKVSLSQCMIACRNHAIGKFYKLSNCREKNIRYPELRRCEDVAFVCRAIDACETVYYLNEPLYYYYQRSTSLSNNKKLDETDMVKAFNVLEKTLGDKYPEEIKEKSVSDLLYGGLLMMCKSGKAIMRLLSI